LLTAGIRNDLILRRLLLVRNTGLGRLLVILMLRPVLVVVHSGGAGGRDPESERLLPQPDALEEV